MSNSGRLEAITSSVATSTLASSFVDGLRAYQRSQLLLSESNVPSGTESNSESESDTDDSINAGSPETFESLGEGTGGDQREDSLLLGGELSGDEADRELGLNGYHPASSSISPLHYARTETGPSPGPVPLQSRLEGERPSERSPLIPSRVSFGTPPAIPPTVSPLYPKGVRRTSQTSGRPRRTSQGRLVTNLSSTGASTFGQTLFNTIAALIGIGLLSEPLAFAYAGWLGGAILLSFYAVVACYTAILLANIMFSDPRIRTYADIGRKAFGKPTVPLISFLFCLELFSLSIVLVTLFADSLHAVVPTYSKTTYKLFSLLIIVPTAMLPLSLLAYTSVIGILSTLLIIFVLFFDGFGKASSPAFGLFMAGFSGHAIVPSLARDMRDPTEFNSMIRWAFLASTLFYAVAGAAGYLMFGDRVSDEISQDLIATPGYSQSWNHILMWMLVLMPISKYALGTRPLNTTFESFLGIDSFEQSQIPLPRLLPRRLLSRALSAAASIAVSIAIPEFSTVMAFLGSFSAFTICIIGPISAHIKLNGARWWDTSILIVACIMALWGTCAAFWP